MEWLTRLTVRHPYRTFNEPASVSPERLAIPPSYNECTDWMRYRAQRLKAESRGWPSYELASGHQAMTTAAEALAELLDELSNAGGD